MAAAATPRLSDSQRAELIGLVDESDSVELKISGASRSRHAMAPAVISGPTGCKRYSSA